MLTQHLEPSLASSPVMFALSAKINRFGRFRKERVCRANNRLQQGTLFNRSTSRLGLRTTTQLRDKIQLVLSQLSAGTCAVGTEETRWMNSPVCVNQKKKERQKKRTRRKRDFSRLDFGTVCMKSSWTKALSKHAD